MKISYLITLHNETDTFKQLLDVIIPVNNSCDGDEIIILDDYSDNVQTKDILKSLNNYSNIKIYQSKLNNDYGEHKNKGITLTNGDFIYQLDADEIPSEYTIGENLHNIIESNPEIECFIVPRLNLFDGVTDDHAKQWGWRLTTSKLYNKPIVNFSDPQYRIFKRDYPRISYKRKLHEKIEGYLKHSVFPQEEEWSMLHVKTIEKQIQTNLKYNQKFSVQDNQGFSHKF